MENTEIILSDGRKATVLDFKGHHIRQAQRLMGDDTSLFLFALISLCVEIEGKPVLIEDLDHMPGKDVMKLQAEFSGANF